MSCLRGIPLWLKKPFLDYMSFKLFITALLLAAGVLCFSAPEDVETGGTLLPGWLQVSSDYVRWVLLLVLLLIGPVVNQNGMRYQGLSYWLFILFYALLTLDSLINAELMRYVGMTLLVFSIPLWISHVIRSVGFPKFFRSMLMVAILVTGIGAYASLGIKGIGARYTGIAFNANAFALINMFFIAIAVICSLGKIFRGVTRAWAYSLLIFCSLTQLLSGSRGGMLGLIGFGLIYLLMMRVRIRMLIWTGVCAGLVYLLFRNFSTEAVDRLRDVASVTSDTGRDQLWSDVFRALDSGPFFGFGTDSRLDITGSGNAHNVYVALFLFAGYAGGAILSLVYIFASLAGALFQRKAAQRGFDVINAAIVAYLASLALMSFGEDAPLGIGSPWFIYILFSLGIIGAVRESVFLGKSLA